MNKAETLEDFYKARLKIVPQNLRKEIGHFNVFRFEELTSCIVQPISYSRRDFFKIGFIQGRNKIYLADKTESERRTALGAEGYHWGLDQAFF